MAKKKYLDEVGLAQVVGIIRGQIDDINTEIDNLTVSSVECDTELSDTSENPVQNKVIKAAIDDVAADLANYLPLTGGMIDSALTRPVDLNSNSSSSTVTFGFYKNLVMQGQLGFNGVDNPVFITSDGSKRNPLLHSGNYNSYSPTLTGTGASGTWGISISGNAATASAVAWGNVTGKPSSMPASDVYSWAKASSKPSYVWSEIGSKPTTFTPSSHNQAASTITAGTFSATGVVAATGTDYTTNRIRNTVFTTTDPGAGVSTSHANGSIICVYE